MKNSINYWKHINVYVFKKAYPTLPSREYLIKSSDNESLREELILRFGESISFAKTYVFGLMINIENLDLLPIEEKQFFLTNNPEFNQLLETYQVYVFLQAFPTAVSESLQKTYMIKTPYRDELKEELLLRYSEGIPLVEKMPGEGITLRVPAKYAENNIPFIANGILFWENPQQLPVRINVYSITGAKVFSIQSAENKINLSLHLRQTGVYIVEVIENGRRYSGHFINR